MSSKKIIWTIGPRHRVPAGFTKYGKLQACKSSKSAQYRCKRKIASSKQKVKKPQKKPIKRKKPMSNTKRTKRTKRTKFSESYFLFSTGLTL